MIGAAGNEIVRLQLKFSGGSGTLLLRGQTLYNKVMLTSKS